MNKTKSRNNPATLRAREDFSLFLDEMFDIRKPGLQKIIENDRMRSDSAKKEDLAFLKDQESARKMHLGSSDEVYEKRTEDKRKRGGSCSLCTAADV